MALSMKAYTYEEAVNNLAFNASFATGKTVQELTEYYSQFTADEVANLMLQNAGDVYSSYAQNGTIKLYYGKPTVTNTIATGGSINSNMATTIQGSMKPVIETTVDATTQEVTLATKAATIGGKAVNFFTGSVVPAVAAASVGISLGKTIDSALYNLNPDFWDAHGMSTLDPTTWASITNGDDSLGAKLFNYVFGIDEDGNTQAYLDEEAYAYLAQYMNSAGFFSSGMVPSVDVSDFIVYPVGTRVFPPFWYFTPNSFINLINNYDGDSVSISFDGLKSFSKEYVIGVLNKVGSMWGFDVPLLNTMSGSNYWAGGFGRGGFIRVADALTAAAACPKESNPRVTANNSNTITLSRYITDTTGGARTYPVLQYTMFYDGRESEVELLPSASWSTLYNILRNSYTIYKNFNGNLTQAPIAGGVEYGSIIPDQPSATLPTTDSWTSPQDTLQSLQNQYPDLWNQAVPITTLQPDGTTTTTNYIPVPMPNATSATDTQPVSGDQTQSATDTSTTSMDAIKTLVSELLATPVDNSPDTGSGSSPTPVPIGATASSLWAIYHPTEAQVDSFGAWLWSPGLINQIQALMFSPIESVISLHKIYATPVDVGATTIQVGYLDSEVPSNYVEEQYVYVDCGSVYLAEYFGNVFDYSPNTSINLYLPFIGIVPLDVDSVMRGSIGIVYGVDILTGDCLAMIEVQRDGCTSIQYQYSGNCAVHYPLTAGNYMAMLTNSLTGAVSGFAGGGIIGAVAGGALGAMRTGADVRRSGNFSGNSGAMGGKIPYLIIERPQTRVAGFFEHYQGYPTNAYVTVGECSGYIKASTLHTDGISATDTEIDMIRKAFISGVIV
jgi:hypothetical protein